MTEDEFKEMLADLESASRQGEWDIARNRILSAYRDQAAQLAAAREVVKKLQALGHWVVINTTCDAGLFDVEVRKNGRSSMAEIVVFEPAPRAICIAACLAVYGGEA